MIETISPEVTAELLSICDELAADGIAPTLDACQSRRKEKGRPPGSNSTWGPARERWLENHPEWAQRMKQHSKLKRLDGSVEALVEERCAPVIIKSRELRLVTESQRDQAYAERDRLAQRVDGLLRDAQGDRERISSLLATLATVTGDLNAARRDCEAYIRENAALHQEHTATARDRDALKAQNEVLEKQLHHAKVDLSDLVRRNANLEVEGTKAALLLEVEKQEHEKAKAQLTYLGNRLTSLESVVAQANDGHTQMQRMLSDCLVATERTTKKTTRLETEIKLVRKHAADVDERAEQERPVYKALAADLMWLKRKLEDLSPGSNVTDFSRKRADST